MRAALKSEGLGGVVGELGSDSDAGYLGLNIFAGFVERGLGDIDRLIEDVSLPAYSGGKEQAGLGGGSSAEFEEGQSLAA